MKIEIIVNRGDIKKLFINNRKISKFDIPSDKLDEELKLAKKPKRKINGRILMEKFNPNFL
tara:strand:+ start:312 stop:494 length:183 start_codon:yes stop_codon:yes gene_type:complete